LADERIWDAAALKLWIRAGLGTSADEVAASEGHLREVGSIFHRRHPGMPLEEAPEEIDIFIASC